MKLGELFSCCLSVGRKKRRNERVNTSNKNKRREAKRLKKEVADRRRIEELEMNISKAESVESLDEGKDGTAERMDGGEAVMAIHPTEMTHARPVSAEEDNISEPETSKADCDPNESSVDNGTPQFAPQIKGDSSLSSLLGAGDGAQENSQEDGNPIEVDQGKPQLSEGDINSPSSSLSDGNGAQELSREDCNPTESSADQRDPQLDEAGGKSSTPLLGDVNEAQELIKEDCTPIKSSIDQETQLSKDDSRSRSPSTPLSEDDGAHELNKEFCKSSAQVDIVKMCSGVRSMPRLKLDHNKFLPKVGKPTPKPEACRTAGNPQKRDTTEQDRRRVLLGFFERRGITISSTLTTLKIVGEKSAPAPAPPSPSGVWRTPSTPQARDVMEEERRRLLHGFFERRGLTNQGVHKGN